MNNSEGTQSSKPQFRPIDSVIVLFIGCTLALLFLLIASAVTGSSFQLPPIVTKTYSSVWTYVTGAGASIFLSVFRLKTGKNDEDKTRPPNYLVWSLSTSILLLAVVFATALAMQRLPAPDPYAKLVLLRLWLDKKVFLSPNLAVLQKNPLFREARTIGPDPTDGHYQELFDWPIGKGQTLEIFANPIAIESERVSGPDKELKFCFVKNPTIPTNQPPFEVQVQCTDPGHCDFTPKDFGWAEKCPADTQPHASILDRMHDPVVFAQAILHPAGPGWRVPSLSTLSQLQKGDHVGYTAFHVKTGPAKELSKAKMFRYEIVANGTPLYVDGWSPANMLKEFDPEKEFDFSFAVENLDFSGVENGCENLELQLTFLNGDETVKEVTLRRKYAALRDASTKTIDEGGDLQFVWSGNYVKPKIQNRSEVFVLSTSDVQEAASLKKKIDAAGESFEGQPAVAVIRPPLDSDQYGVVMGLRQGTGQVSFTFDPATASRILSWARGLHVSNPRLFRGEPNIYSMRPGESGAGRHQSCSN